MFLRTVIIPREKPSQDSAHQSREPTILGSRVSGCLSEEEDWAFSRYTDAVSCRKEGIGEGAIRSTVGEHQCVC